MINIIDGSLKFDTQIDTTGFKTGTNTIKSQANGLKNTLLGLGKLIALVFSVAALARFGKQAIDLASDLQEVQNVVDTAFGDMAYKMEEFAETSIETYGLSKLASKQMGSLFMAMSKGMGQASAAASDMAVNITGRLGDIMSFYNLTAEEAKTIGKAIYTSETEPLKAIGLVATEANLSLFALQKGFKTAYTEMSANDKLLVRQMYFLEQTSIAAGDFAKTSGSWANQTRVLSENWKEFLGIIGQGLIQVLTPVIKSLNTAMSYMIKFASVVSNVLSSVFGLEKSTSNLAGSTAEVATGSEDASVGIADMGKATKKASKDAKGGTASFDKLNNTTESIADNSESAADALSNMGVDTGIGLTPDVGEPNTSGLEVGISKTVENIKNALKPALDALDRLKIAIEPFAKNVGEGLKWFLDNVIIPIGGWVISSLVPAFLDTLGASIGVLNSIVEVFKPYGSWLWENFLQPVGSWVGGAIIETLGLITVGLNNLSTWIMDNQGLIASAAILIASFFLAFKVVDLVAFIAPVLGMIGSMIASGTLLSTVLGAIGTVLGSIFSPITAIAAVLGLLIYTFIDLYKNSDTFRQSIVNLGQTWKAALEPLATFVGTVLSDAWNKILKPIVEFFVKTLLPNLVSLFKKLWENVLVPLANFIGTVLQPVFQVLSDLLGMLWEKVILPLASAIGTSLKAAWDGIYEILSKTIIPIIKTVIDVLTKLWKNFINPIIKVLWDSLKPAFDTVFTGIGDLIKGLEKIFGGIIDFITGVFTGNWQKAWEGIKKIFGGIWDSLVAIVKVPINLIIDIINGLVGGIVSGINTIIGAVNSINFKVPDWVPGIGGNDIGFNLKEIKAPKIPKLATGTVVPKNFGEFKAILGDNQREPEIVSPLSLMKQALREVMQETGKSSQGIAHYTITLGKKVLFDGMVEAEAENYANTGNAVFAH